jgi:hypothetical protein
MNSTSKIVFAVLAIMALLCFASVFGLLHLPVDGGFAFLSGTLFAIAALGRL